MVSALSVTVNMPNRIDNLFSLCNSFTCGINKY